MVMKIKLREWANLPEETVLRWLNTRRWVEVTDDLDQVALTDTYALIITWHGMIIHRHYNDVPYSIKEMVPSNKVEGAEDTVYNDGTNATPINQFLKVILPTIIDPVEVDGIKRLIHIWQNKLNNLLVVMSERYVISATAESVAEFMEDEGISGIRDRVLSKEISIDEGEREFADYVRTAHSIANNTLTLLSRTGGVAINQAYQKTIIRGKVFDLNNSIMPNAITVPYAHGITNLADMLGERNAAGKSLTNNGKALKSSEWFHRKVHILSAVVADIDHFTDCGTTTTVPIRIPNMQAAMALLGKFRVTDTGELELIDQTTVWSIKPGEWVNIRSVAFCNHYNSASPCRVCYGMMASSIPYNVMMKKGADVGMWCTTSICNPIGQGMLSTKHFIRNATTRKFVPATKDKNVIYSNGDDIFLTKELCAPGTELVLKADIVNILSDIRSLDVLDNLSLDKLPYFSEVTFRYEVEDIMMGGKTLQQHAACTSVSSRNARFSLEFLNYLLSKGWANEGKKHITVDLSEWNTLSPIFTLPYVREDLDMHRARVENFITFNKRNNAWRQQIVTPRLFGEVLAEYWGLINQETKGINIIHPEVLLYSTLCRDPMRGDYSLANGNGPKYFVNFQECIKGRGAGMLMIYENQQNVLSDPKTFRVVNRQGSPLECFFSLAVS